MITEKDIQEQRKLLQSEIMNILSGVEDGCMLENMICQALEERMNILIEKLKS